MSDSITFTRDATPSPGSAPTFTRDPRPALTDEPGYEYGQILPFRKQTSTGNIELAVPEIIRAPIRGLTTNPMTFDITDPQQRADVGAAAAAFGGFSPAPGRILAAPHPLVTTEADLRAAAAAWPTAQGDVVEGAPRLPGPGQPPEPATPPQAPEPTPGGWRSRSGPDVPARAETPPAAPGEAAEPGGAAGAPTALPQPPLQLTRDPPRAPPTGRQPSPGGPPIALPDDTRETLPQGGVQPTSAQRRPRSPPPVTPFVPVPKEPERLINFLRRKTVLQKGTPHEETIPGGIKDVGGDLAAMIGGARARPGLINNRTGRSWNSVREHAHGAGYFPSHPPSGAAPDDERLIHSLILQDHEGTPVYSSNDEEQVRAYQDAIAVNHEIDRLAAEHDLPTSGITHAEFFDRLHDRLSQDDWAAEHAEIADQRDDDWAEAVRQAGYDPGEWNGDDEYGIPRSLEDLENEHRQEQAAEAARGRQAGDARPGPVGQSEGGVPEGVPQHGGGAGDAGRGGPGEGPPRGFAQPIDAYHGTPHDFEAFDTGKIGTGEGAQSYGHGLYFAQNPGVARSYRDQLAGNKHLRLDPRKLQDDLAEPTGFSVPAIRHARTILEAVGGIVDHALGVLDRNYLSGLDPMGQESAQVIRAMRPSMGQVGGGNLYTVRINAEPEELLDWDKPLSEQSEKIKKALTPEGLGLKAAGPYGEKGYYAWIGPDRKPVGMLTTRGPPSSLFDPRELGMTLYRAIHTDPATASSLLARAGIKGIRYLDAGSRAEGEGTHNVVVFDHNDIEITHRNGEPIKPKAMTKAEADGMLEEQRDLFGREAKTPAKRAPEPTIRNDPAQGVMPGMEPSARQAQAARDAAPPKTGQQAPGGLFAPRETEQPPLPTERPQSRWHDNAGFRDMLAEFPPLVRSAHEHAADWVLERGEVTGHEHLAVVDNRTGQVIHAGTAGLPNFLPFSHENTLGDRERYTIHHNHPLGTSLSVEDIGMLANPGISHVVAHGPGGDTYYASLGPKIASTPRVTIGGVTRAINKMDDAKEFANAAANRIVRPLYDAGTYPDDVANRFYFDVRNRLLDAAGIINYASTLKLPTDVARPLKKLMEQSYGPRVADRSTRTIQPTERTAGLPQRVEGGSAQGQPVRETGGEGGGAVSPPGRLLEYKDALGNELLFLDELVRD